MVKEAPIHGIAGVDILAHGMGHEAQGRDNRYLATGYIRFINNAAHATKVVSVGVGLDHCRDRTGTQFFGNKIQGSSGGFLAGERIKHDPALVALNEGDVR